MDCVLSYEVSVEEGGATVEYLNDYMSPQDISDHIEEQTSFVVSCVEAVEE